ncbi:MAG: hypothetical protein GX771_01800 [Halomonadaceae bacterium]|nr:hypothetical protein [Halomonadaceae bacterium]
MNIPHHDFTTRLPACLLPPGIVVLTERLMVIDVSPHRRQLSLTNGAGSEIILNAPVPRLLVAGALNDQLSAELHVVGIRRRGQLTEDTPLFHAPLMGIDQNGLMTARGAGLPSRISPNDHECWVSSLFSARSVTVGHERTVRPANMTARATVNTYHHIRFWREIAREHAPRFPGSALVDKRQRLIDWISELEYGRP